MFLWAQDTRNKQEESASMKPAFIIGTGRLSVSLAWLPSGLTGAGAGEKRDFFFSFSWASHSQAGGEIKNHREGRIKNNGLLMG